MDARTDTRMSVTDFGEALIRTRDLDPVYVAIHGAQLPRDQLCRLLLAYLSFYHLGVAAYISEPGPFWGKMIQAAENAVPAPLDVSNRLVEGGQRPWPRAAERRHFRGQKCVDAVRWLAREFERPEAPIEHLTLTNLPGGGGGLTEKIVMERVECWPMFSKWAAFKAADLVDRTGLARVEFSQDIGLMYEAPRKGLKLMDGDARENYQRLLDHISQWPAPPANDRPCGPAEAETCLCKWSSYMSGGYFVGKDIKEVRHALHGWGETVEHLLVAAPEEVP